MDFFAVFLVGFLVTFVVTFLVTFFAAFFAAFLAVDFFAVFLAGVFLVGFLPDADFSSFPAAFFELFLPVASFSGSGFFIRRIITGSSIETIFFSMGRISVSTTSQID